MNDTIKTQLEHRSIRKFEDTPISDEVVETLINVAQRTSTSSFMQAYSIIRVKDESLKQKIAAIAKQKYVGEAQLLLIFLSDMNRNASIAKAQGVTPTNIESFDRFFSSATDAILAAQNVMVALESLGLGGVFLGSILNDAQELIKLLKLPDYVVPVLGLAIGYADQSPQLKPRLPKEFVYMEDTYTLPDISRLSEYDAIVQEYYDLRDANRRIDAFTTQVASYVQNHCEGRKKLLEYYQQQKIIKY